MRMTRLDILLKLVAKFGNTINVNERNVFKKKHLKTLRFPKVITDNYEMVNVVTGKGDNAVTTQEPIIGNDCKVHSLISIDLFVALLRISKSEYKSELRGKLLCFDPELMRNSKTDVAYTSWGLAFRFNQQNELSQGAKKIFTDVGFTIGIDKDNKEYFIADLEKLLK